MAMPSSHAQAAAPLPILPFGRPYEMMVIFRPSVEVEGVDASIRVIENLVRQLRGKFIKVEKIGRKRLAYEIKKSSDGWIVNIVFQLSATQVKELRRQCMINEAMLRFTLTQLPKTYDLLKNASVNVVSKKDRLAEKAAAAEKAAQQAALAAERDEDESFDGLDTDEDA